MAGRKRKKKKFSKTNCQRNRQKTGWEATRSKDKNCAKAHPETTWRSTCDRHSASCRRRMGKAPKVNVPEEHPKAKFHLGTFTAPPPLCLVTLICSAVSMLTCDHSSSCCVLLPASSHRCACLCPERHVQVEERSGPASAWQAILERHVEARELEGFSGVSHCAIF